MANHVLKIIVLFLLFLFQSTFAQRSSFVQSDDKVQQSNTTLVERSSEIEPATVTIHYTLSDTINHYIELIALSLKDCPDKMFLKDSLMALSKLPNFFVDAKIVDGMPVTKRNVRKDLSGAFKTMTHKSQKDSIALVVNYVYANYIVDDPYEIQRELENIDSIATLLSEGLMSGHCGEETRYLSQIIAQVFPWWGYGIEFCANTDTLSKNCNVSHIFLGLANKNGEVKIILDPSVNGIWMDSLTGHLLSLKEGKEFLLNPQTAWRVCKYSSTHFGKFHSEKGDGPDKILGINFSSANGITAHAVVGQPDNYVIRGAWRNFDDENALMTQFNEHCWKQLNFPRMTWANNMLTIRSAWCTNADILAKFLKPSFPMPE